MARRLTDLYKVGKEVTFSIDNEPDLTVWIQKLQPFEQELCITRAQGERAKVWALKNLPDDDEERAVHIMQVEDEFSHEEMVNLAASDELSKAHQSAESFVAMDDDENNLWAKDGYLEGLQEAWAGAQLNLHNTDDPTAQKEAQRVFEELKRYNVEVEKEFAVRKADILFKWENTATETLKALCVNKIIEVRADIRWMAEYERSEVWLATREENDHQARYFDKREEVDQLAPIALNRLINEYKEVMVGPDEVKS